MSAQRDQILRAASVLLKEGGLEQLTVRRLADQAGVTTMSVYKYFEGKHGIIKELKAEGFELLKQAQDGVESAEPQERILALCRAYRALAHNQPEHYRLMLLGPTGEPVESQTFHTLAQACSQLSDDPKLAEQLFALCHGVVSLELAGYLETSDDFFERQLETFLKGAVGQS